MHRVCITYISCCDKVRDWRYGTPRYIYAAIATLQVVRQQDACAVLKLKIPIIGYKLYISILGDIYFGTVRGRKYLRPL